jgi:hypothetical protein
MIQNSMIDLLHGIIGIVFLTMGRRLFWLFVAGVGFVVGLQLAQQYLGTQPPWAWWLIALLCGGIGAMIAVFFQTLAIGLGGFAAGSIIGAHLASLLGSAAIPPAALAGGIVGAIFLYLVFDWALIGLSAVFGATLIVRALDWNNPAALALYLVLTAAGIWFQAFLRNGRSRIPRKK